MTGFPAIPKDSNQVPIGTVYIPGVGFVALQGANSSSDGLGNPSAPAALIMPDAFGVATTITAATTFSGVPTVSQIAANSSVLLTNPGGMATFLAAIEVASAFSGTLSFYGLEPDGVSLTLISAHLRNSSTIGSSTAISVVAALNQLWTGSIAAFKAVYVVCTTFTSGSVSVQLGLSAAPYAMIITNTTTLGQATMANSAPVVLASDQSNVPTVLKNLGWTSLYTTTQTGVSSWAGSGDIDVHLYSQLMISCQVTAITGTSIQFRGNRKDSFANYALLWNPAANTSAPSSALTSWGPGLSTNHVFGGIITVTVVLVAITSVSFTVDVQGR